MSGMHHQSLYPIFDRLMDKGYAYTDHSRPQRIYLTAGGKEIVTDITRLWADILRLSKRKMVKLI
jgi:DNA-binding PadR family transcriptional regulator